jgi:hypothetical protein
MPDALPLLSQKALEVLRRLSEQTGEPIPILLDKAVEHYRRKLFLEAANASYAALRADPAAWAEELAERRALEGTLMDGLDPEERWSDDGRPLPPAEGTSPR